MEAEALLKSADVAGARASLAALLRDEPDNAQARQFFWQLIALHGEWDKAGSQLQVLASTQPKAMMLASVYNQALAAMLVRDAVWAGQQPPQSIVVGEPWVQGLLDALHAAVTALPDAIQRSNDALDAAPPSAGHINGESFQWIADADQRFGPMLELIIGDQYGFVPWAAIRRVRTKGPEDLRDLVWLPADIELKSGQTSAALLPTTYPGTGRAGHGGLMLARATRWEMRDGFECGLGQHLLATDQSEIGLLELRDLVID